MVWDTPCFPACVVCWLATTGPFLCYVTSCPTLTFSLGNFIMQKKSQHCTVVLVFLMYNFSLQYQHVLCKYVLHPLLLYKSCWPLKGLINTSTVLSNAMLSFSPQDVQWKAPVFTPEAVIVHPNSFPHQEVSSGNLDWSLAGGESYLNNPLWLIHVG